jgi:hypothetical protein
MYTAWRFVATTVNRSVLQPATSLYSKAEWSLCAEMEIVLEMDFQSVVVKLITQEDTLLDILINEKRHEDILYLSYCCTIVGCC